MKLYHISLNSLWRRKTRMAFLLIGLTVAVATVVILSHVSLVMREDIARKLDEYGANILITPRSDDLALSYGGMSIAGVAFDVEELKQEDLTRIRQIKNRENISIVAPKLLSAARIGTTRAMVVGVDFEAETALKKWWRITGQSPSAPDEVLIGSEVKAKLNLSPGQTLVLQGQTYRIAGVLNSTGSQDDGLVFMNLAEAQRLFNKPGVITLAEVAALCYDCPIEVLVAQISEQLPQAKVVAVRQTIQTKMETMGRFEHFSLGISIVIVIVGGLIVFTTITASVNERKREIGVFRSIGFRRGHIIQIILLEGLWLSGLAGIVGYGVGFLLARYTAAMLGVTSVAVIPNLVLLAGAIAMSVFIGIIASLYPSIQASRLDPTTALRAL